MAWVPTRPISMSVAMLSLVEIILPAASRTVIWDPGGSLSKPDEPSFFSSAVIVSLSSQFTVPAATAVSTAYNTYVLKKIEASGRDSEVLVPATFSQRPSSTLETCHE